MYKKRAHTLKVNTSLTKALVCHVQGNMQTNKDVPQIYGTQLFVTRFP